MSKVISRLLWSCITTLCDWLTKLAPLSQPMGMQTKTNRVCAAHRRTRFPALGAGYMYLLRILLASLCCLHLLRLVKDITLVLVLRHSIGNRSTILPCNSFDLPRKIGKMIFLGRSKRPSACRVLKYNNKWSAK